MPKKGRDLEQLVHLLESNLADNATTQLESPLRVRDTETGQVREHDVGLRITTGPRTVLTAIECRDRSRKIGAPDVEAFKKKCDATGVNKGVMVSSKGFCKTARLKAKLYGIDCLELKEATRFNWLGAGSMEHASTRILSRKFLVFPKDLQAAKAGSVAQLFVGDQEVALVNLDALVGPALSLLTPPGTPAGIIKQGVRFPVTSGMTMTESPAGPRIPVDYVVVELEIEVTVGSAQFTLHSYSDANRPQDLAQVARVPVGKGSPFNGELVFLNKPGEGTQILLQLRPEAKPPGAKTQ